MGEAYPLLDFKETAVELQSMRVVSRVEQNLSSTLHSIYIHQIKCLCSAYMYILVCLKMRGRGQSINRVLHDIT